MRKSSLLGAFAILFATLGPAVMAQEAEGVLGPGSRYGLEPDSSNYPSSYDEGAGHNRDGGFYRGYQINPFDATAGVISGAAETATAPFRALGGNDAYAMDRNDGYCAERYRSYDPASGTFMGYDGRRHPCL
ncbi:BA14K family protein [Bradyrhizobium sp.]|uniref:BA14K family protein n=1 Tax=Bradyrhizobium sp. TaxID=376 RepID=UPI003C686C6B